MTPTPPQVALDGRYPIGKAAALLGIHRNTLLRATKAGDIRARKCRANERKIYLGREILRYWQAEG